VNTQHLESPQGTALGNPEGHRVATEDVLIGALLPSRRNSLRSPLCLTPIDIKILVSKLILLEHTPLLARFFVERPKLLLFRRINFRKQYFYIGIGVKCSRRGSSGPFGIPVTVREVQFNNPSGLWRYSRLQRGFVDNPFRG